MPASPSGSTAVVDPDVVLDLPESAVLADVLAKAPASIGVRPDGDEHRQVITYFDTVDDDLRRAGVRLRREQRVDGSAWILRPPADLSPEDPEPLRRPDSAVVPAPFADLLLGVRRGGRLRTVARLTVRTQAHLVGDDGQRLVDETVEAAVPGGTGTVLRWRRVRVPAGPAQAAVVKALRRGRTGARRSTTDDLDRARPLPSSPVATRKKPRAADAAGEYVAAQVQMLLAGDLGLRRGHDVVHPTRVATRRLRSTLRVFGELFDAGAAAALDAELAWFAAQLGEVRDREVLRRRLDASLAGLPEELVLGPVAARIATTLDAERATQLERLRRTLRGARYRALLDELVRWRSAPPFTDAAERPATALRRSVARARRRVDRRLAAGLRGDDQSLHRARKAAKRLRYAVELAGDALPKTARADGPWAKKVQTVLGEHQDATVAADVLRRLGAAAGRDRGENGFTFGLLLAGELDRAATSRDRAARLTRRG